MLSGRQLLVTGGAGFLGSALARGLLASGARVRVLDDGSRGGSAVAARRLGGLDVDFVSGDVRDAETVAGAARDVDAVCHLAYVNGTEHFYSRPAHVLDVAVRGMLAVLDACRSERVPELVLFSSSEVYQTPPRIPTSEDVPLSVPDPRNPRYSYGGGKIASELLALHSDVPRVVVVRPHNAYGPDMGFEHAIPQLTRKLRSTVFPEIDIQGDGGETRAYCFVEDLVAGTLIAMERGEDRGVYHVGTEVETSTRELVAEIARLVGFELGVIVRPGPLHTGSPLRRCPDITKMRAIGYSPRVSLREGLARTVPWYLENEP